MWYLLKIVLFVLLDEFNEFCDRLEKTSEWGGQAEVVHVVAYSLMLGIYNIILT